MQLLLDESLPVQLRDHSSGHQVSTVGEMGWRGTKNGLLLALAGRRFDALITADKSIRYQQNLKTLPLAVVVLGSTSNSLNALLPLVGPLKTALAGLVPKTIVTVIQ